MRFGNLLAIGAICGVLAGCGGGGGGASNPPVVALGTFQAATDRSTASASFSANVVGANAIGTTVQVYGDERTGPINAYTASHRLTFTIYGPVAAGTYPISASPTAGTARVVYVETAKQNGAYVTTGEWPAGSGSITIAAADGSHVQGTFTVTATNAATGNVIHFTNGKFNVAYETPPAPLG